MIPSYQKLALNCNSRWRYKGSKFDSHILIIFGKDPFPKDALLENGTKSIISQIYFFVTSHFGTL